jgi:hypothetical protein
MKKKFPTVEDFVTKESCLKSNENGFLPAQFSFEKSFFNLHNTRKTRVERERERR